MADSVQGFLDRFIRSLERFGELAERLAASFLKGILEFLEKAYQWIAELTVRIKTYLVRFFKAIGKLSVALLKLSLFYLPSVLLLVLYFVWDSTLSLLGAITWFGLVTLIGLSYGKNK